ncbi:YoaK family protein [Acetobacter oeni]|uniref:DUF1275 family protein n=1 Tax=Acetobacter oeni TaxID=304077 RepID=A0A511XN01_9PROT|nr:YoaK family protein [Acetobacter oeni]MBB3881530.1 uncharacterized membrane protein YoaK (UPF0700 family) [Acetobacter oeni]NHO18393.1 DUF1275 domain-containing protein [Acetobacter oeni]GBR10724.1 hypothetical protein AA21952_3141 [Acetobacter oeni LMG 21952]GEN64316.1 hypothetical protein AOE01nite_25400 [Acetobacter oeni]
MSLLTRSALRVLALGLVAGYVDAVGYVELHGIFTAAMTGNSTTFGIALADGDRARAAAVGTVLGLFFCGALAASLLRRALPAYRHEWLWMAGLLVIAQGVHWSHAAGGSSRVETLLLAVAMAMQGEALSRFSGISVQTIVVTNNIVKFADNIAGFLCGLWRGKPGFTLASALPGLGWAGCIAGAFLSVFARGLTSGFFLAPVPLLVGLFFLWPGEDVR